MENWEDEFNKDDGRFFRVVTTLPPNPENGRIGINAIKDELKFFIRQLLAKKKKIYCELCGKEII